MKHVFGPVPSKRLGQSLGIDPVPLKTCNWNCVYCQLGRTRPLVNERKEFFASEEILDQVKKALQNHQPGEIDWITFVGSGETMLNSKIGWMICEIKTFSNLPVAVITNGSLLNFAEVREELATADAVLPTLDAGNADLYKRINRPHPALTYKSQVEGLQIFSREYEGDLWVELMLVKGLNDTEQALKETAAVLDIIEPDEVHIMLPTRPPVETWVEPPDDEGLLRAQAILGDVAKIFYPISGIFDLSGEENLLDAVVGIITRHPMKEEELVKALTEWSAEDAYRALEELEKSGRAQVIERYDVRFWSAAPASYPNHKKVVGEE
jgi:wyosine [tRNA(Phe)-imidazoG37] synthetase (radical SAM superfamily)